MNLPSVDPTSLEVITAWVLIVALGYSMLYEVWRDFFKAGTTKHDSPKQFWMLVAALYGPGAIIIWMLLAGITGSDWAGLVYSLLWLFVSMLYYHPQIIVDRQPDIWAWIESVIYTGLLFVASALLLLEVFDYTLIAG